MGSLFPQTRTGIPWWNDEFRRQLQETPDIVAEIQSPTASATPEASWLSDWRQTQTASVDTMKADYETELTGELQEWTDLAKSTKWLTSGEYQGLVAAESYRTARKQEIADWYKDVMATLDLQSEELEGVQQLQADMDAQSVVLSTVLSELNSELEAPTSAHTVNAKTEDFVGQVEKQVASLTAYRDWLRKQGTTAEDEISQAKEQGLPEEQWLSTDDRIRELQDLITWANDIQAQLQRQPTWKPWTSEFWRERALGFLVNTALPKVAWLDTTWSIFAAQVLQRGADALPGDSMNLFGASESSLLDLYKMEGGTYVHKPWDTEAHELWTQQADPAAQSVLGVLNPVWFVPIERVAGGALKGLEGMAQGGKLGARAGESWLTRLAVRNVEIERLAIEAGLETRGFKTVAQIAGRTPGLVEHYLPQMARGTRVAVRSLYLPVEVTARATLTAIKDIAWLGKNMVVWGWKLATAPIKGAGWILSRGLYRPAMSQLGKLAVPESIKTMAAGAGYEVTLLPKSEQIGKGMLFRVTNREHWIDVMVKDQDELARLLTTGELMPAEMERYYVEQTGKVLSYQQLRETPVAGNVWAERAFRLTARPVGMSEEVWSRGFKALRLDSMEKIVRPAQIMDQFPTIEKFMTDSMQETPFRRALGAVVSREWAMGHMRGIPGLRNLVMNLDPVASEVARAAQAWRNMEEALGIWKASRLAAARQCERFQVEVARREIGQGEYITELIVKNVQARDGKAIAYIGDVLEHPDRFIMSDELRVARDTYCSIIDEARAGLKRFGVEINEVGFEEGGHYFPRYVLGRNKVLINASGPRPGGGFMTKATFEKSRIFDEMSEGIQKGYIYEENPLIVLDSHLDAVCHRIADQEFYRLMKPHGMSQVEIVEHLAPGLRKAVDVGRGRVKALESVDKTVKVLSAVEPHRAPKPATMRWIRKHMPEVWAELKTIRTQATADEKTLRVTLQQYADTFKEMKWQLESLKNTSAAASATAKEQVAAAQQEAREAIEYLTKTLDELAEKPLAQFPAEEKLRDVLAMLPDDLRSEWKASVDMLHDDASRISAGYQAELETAIETLKDDPIYSRTVRYGRTTVKRVVDGKTVVEAGNLRNVTLPGVLLKRTGKDAGMIPETITIEQYRALYGKEPNQSILKQVGKEKRVMSEYAFDEIAEEFGISSDEFVRRINDYPRLQQHVWELSRDAQVANEATERLEMVWRVFKEEEDEAAAAIRVVEAGEYGKPAETMSPEAGAPKPEIPEIKLPTGNAAPATTPAPEPVVGATEKPPWQMTKAEFQAANGDLVDITNHREQIRYALQQGYDVPDEVLTEYPELAGVTKAKYAGPQVAGETPTAPAATAAPRVVENPSFEGILPENIVHFNQGAHARVSLVVSAEAKELLEIAAKMRKQIRGKASKAEIEKINALLEHQAAKTGKAVEQVRTEAIGLRDRYTTLARQHAKPDTEIMVDLRTEGAAGAAPKTALSPTGTAAPKPAVAPGTPSVRDIQFNPRAEAPEVRPSKDWWDRIRMMSANKVKDARLRQVKMEGDLAKVRARAQHPEPFGQGVLFKGERGMRAQETFAFSQTWFPESVAKAIDKQLGDRGAKWLGAVSDINTLARFMMTGMDWGAGMVQGLPLLLMRPDVWAKAQGKTLETFWVNRKASYAYLNMAENQAIIRESIMAGKPLVVGASEFTETMGKGGLTGKVVTAPGLRRTARPLFERYALAFDTFGNVARIEMYKALRPMAKTPEDLPVIIDFINKMTGVRSGVVAGATQRQIEGSLLLFAPRYFRATMSLMFDVFRGGLRGTLARRMMASMLASGALFYYGVSKALGQEPNFDPRTSKFMTVEIGGSHIGFGSIWVSMARMFAGVVATGSDKPGDLLKLSRDDNPLVQFMAGRLAPITGSSLDIIVGKTYVGENLEDPNGFLGKDWSKIGKEVIARNLLPFWLDAQLSENPRPGLASIPAEMFGFRSWALQPWEKRNKLRDHYAMQEFGVTWEQLRLEKPKNNQKAAMASTWGVDAQRYLEEKYGDLSQVTDEARQAVLGRGEAFDALYEEWSNQFDTENERVATLLQRAADEFKYNLSLRDRLNAGDTTLTQDEIIKAQTAGQVFRDKVGQIRDNHRYWRESIQSDPKYAEIYAQLDKWREEGAESLERQGLTEYVGDRAYQAYISLMYETEGLEDQYGNFDYDEYDRRKSEWLSTWGSDMWDYCQKRLAGSKDEPAIVSELRKARKVLKPYWEMQDQITERLKGRYPQTAEEKQKMVRTELTNRLNTISAGIGDLYAQDPEMTGSIWRTRGGKIWKGIIAKVRAQVNSDVMVLDTAVQRARDQLRRDNPDIDFYLRLFYDRQPLDEKQTYSFSHNVNPLHEETSANETYMPLAVSAGL